MNSQHCRSRIYASKSKSRLQGVQAKLAKLRDRVRESTRLETLRYRERTDWWKRAFRTPVLYSLHFVHGLGRSFCEWMLAILGLCSKHFLHRIFDRSSSRFFRAKHRYTFSKFEKLEDRLALANIVVNSTLHGTDADSNTTTLVEAIQLANATPGQDDITLPAVTTFASDDAIFIDPTSAGRTMYPAITSEIKIIGNGSSLNATGKNARFFYVSGSGALTIEDTNLVGGKAQGGDGAGGNFGGGGGGAGMGGAIFVNGSTASLTVRRSTILNSTAKGGSGLFLSGIGGPGGGGGGMGGSGANSGEADRDLMPLETPGEMELGEMGARTMAASVVEEVAASILLLPATGVLVVEVAEAGSTLRILVLEV